MTVYIKLIEMIYLSSILNSKKYSNMHYKIIFIAIISQKIEYVNEFASLRKLHKTFLSWYFI